MTLRVYIAGAARELDRAKWAIAEARKIAGVEITRDWTPDIDAANAAGKRDADYSPEMRAEYASADLQAVRRADVVWLLAPKEGGRGAWVEYGHALSCMDATTIVSGAHALDSIFTELATYCEASDLDALNVIRQLVAHEEKAEAAE